MDVCQVQSVGHCRLTVSHWSVSGEAHGAKPWLSSVWHALQVADLVTVRR